MVFFNGSYTAITQLNWQPAQPLKVGLALGYSFYPDNTVNLSGSTGSALARQPFDSAATAALRLGIQGDWQISDRIVLAAWVGYVNAQARSGPLTGNEADIWNWSANVGIRDLGKKGSLLAIATGMAPRVTAIEGRAPDPETAHLLEVFYEIPLTDNLFLTPGGFIVFLGGSGGNNDDIWVFLLRTSFRI
ncbi:MAG: carbohydrate porin [Chloroflexaceae bacterium]|nr:carbohydrate porin [Chloroflexaceae bacterium]